MPRVSEQTRETSRVCSLGQTQLAATSRIPTRGPAVSPPKASESKAGRSEVRLQGLEPWTYGLKVRCSTD